MPSLQIPQIDGSHRARRQSQPSRYLARRRALAGLSNGLFEALAIGRLARQLSNLFGPYPATRAPHPIRLHHHCCRVLKARQVAHFPFANLVNRRGRHMLSTARTNQLQSRLLPPYPQLQLLPMLVNLHAINPVSGPSKNPRPVVFPHSPRLAKGHFSEKLAFRVGCRIPAQSPKDLCINNCFILPGTVITWNCDRFG